jgi:hypothetical protein
MLTIKDFELLINSAESSVLDFKSSMYELEDGSDLRNTAKLVKDILCFSNTIRNEKSYIIIGVEEKEDGTKNLCGITENIDDARLQDKVKDKIFPRPNFLFYSLKYNEKLFGVFEFPVTKYPQPIYPSIKMKGLDIGRIYHRKGTTNSEAIGHEIILISNWLQNLPEEKVDKLLHDEVGNLIRKLNEGEEKISVLMSDILKMAKLNKLSELMAFSTSEIKGITEIDFNPDEYKYRVQTVKVSLNKIEINPHSFIKATENLIKNEIESRQDFYSKEILFTYSLNEIEEYINRFNVNPDTLCTVITKSSKEMFQNIKGTDYPVYFYYFKDNFLSLYRKIRQKTIERLMEV